MNTFVDMLAKAIKKQEGWFPKGTDPRFPDGSPSWRYNNPGNIMDSSHFKATGRFQLQRYETPEKGEKALRDLIVYYITKLKKKNLYDFFETYAPKKHFPNDPKTYAENIAKFVSIKPTDNLLEHYKNGIRA